MPIYQSGDGGLEKGIPYALILIKSCGNKKRCSSALFVGFLLTATLAGSVFLMNVTAFLAFIFFCHKKVIGLFNSTFASYYFYSINQVFKKSTFEIVQKLCACFKNYYNKTGH